MKTIKAYLSILVLLGMTKFSLSQNRIQIGFDIGSKWDISKIEEGDEYIHTNFRVNRLWGLNVGFEFKKQIFIETGIYKSQFTNSFFFRAVDGGKQAFRKDWENKEPDYIFKAYQGWYIPLRLKYQLNIHKDKIYLTPFIGGGVLMTKKESEKSFSDSSNTWYVHIPLDKVKYTYIANTTQVNAILIETGLEFDVQLSNTISLNIKGIYQWGFTTISTINATYQIYNNQDNQLTNTTTRITSKGNSINLLIGIKYSLSSLWNNEQE